jgi:serine/threonine-protein kinase
VTAPVSVHALPPSFVINGRYEVVRFLGGGATSIVYEVLDQHQGETAALKFILNMPPAAIWVEAQVLTGLRGEYILPVRNADFASGIPFLVTKVAPRTVQHAIAPDVGADVELAITWLRQACRGVARVHDVNLLHTDIKPENLFLDQHNNALVGDFGYASLRDALGHGHYAGTAQTMAPEVATVGTTVAPADLHLHRPTSVASDVYSLGATLYWTLAGQPAHHVPGDQDATMRLVAAGPPPRLRDVAPHIPQALAERVETAMARDPADRYSSAAAFDAALGSLPSVVRWWNRITPHPGHTCCFVGTGHGSDLHVCAAPTGVRTQHEIQISHVGSGRRVNPWPKVPTPRGLPLALRNAFRDHA